MRRRVWIGYIALLAFFFWLATCAEAHAASKVRSFEILVYGLLGSGIALGSAAVAVARRSRKIIARRAKKLKLISTLGAQDADLTVFAPPSAPPESEILIQVMIHPPDRKSETYRARRGEKEEWAARRAAPSDRAWPCADELMARGGSMTQEPRGMRLGALSHSRSASLCRRRLG
jgi:hypothetical protein